MNKLTPITAHETVMTSRAFNQDTGRAKKAAVQGPVIITDRGEPTYVLLSIEDYRRLADRPVTLFEALAPKTKAYHSIWLNGVQLNLEDPANKDFEDPLYGKTYLPRKFKTAFVLPPSNDMDVFTNDLGYIGIVENGRLAGYNIAVGGGMGRSHGNTMTYPRLADVHLKDYKVRILNSESGTGAVVRVLIDSTDGERGWSVVGASTNIIEASWIALSDSIEYFLLTDRERQ